jgi:hypothetical protein
MMLRFMTAAGVLAGAVVLTAAQTQTPAPPAAAGPPAASQQKFVAMGCITRETPTATPGGKTPPPSFVITDKRGPKPTVYRLEGDEKTLTLHVDHMVEVSGPISAGTGVNANAIVMKVEKLTYISKACK